MSENTKFEELNEGPQIVYLVTKCIVVNINEFGDIYGKYPAVDSRLETEYLEKEKIEMNTSENSGSIYKTLESAQIAASRMFVEAKTFVNTLGSRRVIDESERDTDLNPDRFKVSPALHENSVEFDVKVYDDDDKNVHSVCAFIKIVITELTLVE